MPQTYDEIKNTPRSTLLRFLDDHYGRTEIDTTSSDDWIILVAQAQWTLCYPDSL